MSTPAATAACTASWPEWKNVPSPTFWNRCGSSTNGAMPIHWLPSPPIWVMPVMVPRDPPPMKLTMPWQPMPAPTSEPSGTRVPVLCGQPEQKNGVRTAWELSESCRRWTSRGGASRSAGRAMVRTRRNGSTRPSAVSAPLSGIRA